MENTDTPLLRRTLAVLAIVSAAAVVWVASALAGSDSARPSSSSNEPATTVPAATGQDEAQTRGDCPEEEGEDAGASGSTPAAF